MQHVASNIDERMKKLLTILLITTFVSCQTRNSNRTKGDDKEINGLFKRNFEHSLISRGDNFPDFNYSKDSMDLFLIALHENIPMDEFRNKTGFTETKIKKIEHLLESKNWLHYENGKPKPSIFITTDQEGKKLFEYTTPISKEIVEKIENELSNIKQKFNQTEISKTQDFEKWSFLILSDVLLDSWQIDNVEKYFLKKEQRPERHGKNYYYSIMENVENNRETFGIYGNQYDEKDGKTFSIYGNNRIGITDISSKNYISKADNQILNEIAQDFEPTILNVLNRNSDYISKVYKETGYENEISFEEFFIWWYHFIYTKATDIMNEKKMLIVPESGNFEYIIEE
ncbi:hypothetical protein BFP78_12255 [Gaetbulibacter sp. 5U11]|nr:hypothetical protein BFP78_12255 [Gaetbulibacter sp. 5U11]